MALLYETPGLTETQRRQLFADFGVDKAIRHWNHALVREQLRAATETQSQFSLERKRNSERKDDPDRERIGREEMDIGVQISSLGETLQQDLRKGASSGGFRGNFEGVQGEDREGLTIPPDILSRLNGTQVLNYNGAVLAVYHFTPNKAFTIFSKSNDIGFHFGTKAQATKRGEHLKKNRSHNPQLPEYKKASHDCQ